MSCLNSYLRCSHNLRGTFRVLNSRIGSKQNITIGDCASISGDENYLQLKVLYYGYLHIIFSSKYGITAIFRLSAAQNMVLPLSSHYLQLKIWYYGYLHIICSSNTSSTSFCTAKGCVKRVDCIVSCLRPDPDLDMRGGGSPENFFSALWASVFSKNKGSPGEPLPWSRH